MRSVRQWPPAATLILASFVGVLTTGCIVAAGDDRDGWRRDRERREERRDDRHDERRWEYRNQGWGYRG